MNKAFRPFLTYMLALVISLTPVFLLPLIFSYSMLPTPIEQFQQNPNFVQSNSGLRTLVHYSAVPHLRDAVNALAVLVDFDGRVFCSGTVVNFQRNKPIQVLTACHCTKHTISGLVQVGILGTGQVVTMTVQRTHPGWDLAILSSIFPAAHDGPTIKISHEEPQLGESVWIVGNPRGMVGNISHGIISNFLQDEGDLKYYRIDAAMFFGNSGGGLFNARGELLGIARAIEYHYYHGSPQIVPGGGLCVSLYNVKKFLELI